MLLLMKKYLFWNQFDYLLLHLIFFKEPYKEFFYSIFYSIINFILNLIWNFNSVYLLFKNRTILYLNFNQIKYFSDLNLDE